MKHICPNIIFNFFSSPHHFLGKAIRLRFFNPHVFLSLVENLPPIFKIFFHLSLVSRKLYTIVLSCLALLLRLEKVWDLHAKSKTTTHIQNKIFGSLSLVFIFHFSSSLSNVHTYLQLPLSSPPRWYLTFFPPTAFEWVES